MKRDKKSRIAYAAGIIDGEGYIGIKVYKPNSSNGTINYTYLPRIVIKMNSGQIMDFFHGMFGGTVNLVPQKDSGYFPGFAWELTGSKATILLKQTLPFLRTKKKQAEAAIRLQSRINVGIKKRFGSPHGNPLSENEVNIRRTIHEEVKHLNQYAISIPKSGLTTEQAEKAQVAMQLAFKRQSALMGIGTISYEERSRRFRKRIRN
ncbi:MAG: hypothetical protein KKF08_19005 [Gammaproteobacteria bacterium]|nr:hypothetical protein [Gammaproteobacteria bacterium]